jgi:hypothetical protein
VKTLASGRLRQASLAGRRRSRRRFARRANPNAPKREFYTTFVGGHMSTTINSPHLKFTLEFCQTLTTFKKQRIHNMKKSIVPILIAAATALSSCQISENETSTETAEIPAASTTAVTTTTAETKTAAINSADYPLILSSEPIYKDVKFSDFIIDGSPQSYDELDEWLLIYDRVNFVRYEILEVYTPEEAIQLTGDDIFEDGTTLYKVGIDYDYLSQTSVDIEVYLAKAGTPAMQIEGLPLYNIGEVYLSPIKNLERVLNGEATWCVGMAELTYAYYEIEGVPFAYHVAFDKIKVNDPDIPNLDIPLLPEEQVIVTSTENNPVHYTQKSLVSSLGDFIRKDWTTKGFTFLDLKAHDGFRFEDYDFSLTTAYEDEAIPTPAQLNSEDYPLTLSSEPIYKNVKINEMSGTGSPQSYDELDEWLLLDNTLNFVRYEILDVYTPEEAVQITGKDYFNDLSTLYRARIDYDYLHNVDLDIEINVSKPGTAENQFEGRPPYMIGEVYISPLIDLDAHLSSESAWCSTVSELVYAYYKINDMDFAFHVAFDKIKVNDPDIPNLDIPLLPEEQVIVTSTENNPVYYTQKSLASALGDFIREDWTTKGFTFLDLKAQ